MPQTFACPRCDGPIQYEGGSALTITCPFCGSSVVVPEELRTSGGGPQKVVMVDLSQQEARPLSPEEEKAVKRGILGFTGGVLGISGCGALIGLLATVIACLAGLAGIIVAIVPPEQLARWLGFR